MTVDPTRLLKAMRDALGGGFMLAGRATDDRSTIHSTGHYQASVVQEKPWYSSVGTELRVH